MGDVIAVVWDFDKTLVDGYMQDPIFAEYGVNPRDFWDETNREVERLQGKGMWVNPDTFYLNYFLRKIKDGSFKGLNNDRLEKLGDKIRFYPGVEEFFPALQSVINDNETFRTYEIKLEHYIVSTGFRRMIEGSRIKRYTKKIWGCELLEDNQGVPSEIGYSIDNTTKTRAIFEISKGVGIEDRENIDVNTKMKEEDRRVHFVNMVYVADGPSDVPAFSLIRKYGGSTFGVYPKGNKEALKQIDRLSKDGRVQMYAEADYRKDSTAYLWLINTVETMANKIVSAKQEGLKKYGAGTPSHLN